MKENGGSRYEIERCSELANKSTSQRDVKKVNKIDDKAGRVYPTQKTKDLFERTELKSDADDKENKEPNNEGVHHRRGSFGRHTEESLVKEYTEEQFKIVSGILSCKDYYEILGVEKTETEIELNKAYRKLALLTHPDKNKAPGAKEAFQAIGNAYDVLRDKEKRKKYDTYGPEMEEINQRHHAHRDAFGVWLAEDSTLIIVICLVFGGLFLGKAISIIMKKLKRRKKREEQKL